MTTSFSTSGNPWPSAWEPTGEPAWQPPAAADLLQSASVQPRGPQPGDQERGGLHAPWSAMPAQSPAQNADVARWLDEQADKVSSPAVVEDGLRRAGWSPFHAAIEAGRYRARFDEHRLGYSALLVSTGVAALAAGTLGHALAAGIDRSINPNTVAGWLTVLAVSLPFALWGHVWAARVDRDDPVAVWSRPRRKLASALVWFCGIIGIGRLIMYCAQLVGSLVGATWATGDSVGAGAVNVAITISIALPLGLWAFHFLHRFDDEDPATPTPRSRSAAR